MQSSAEPYYLGPSSLGLRLSSPMGMGLWAWGDSLTWGHGSYDKALTEETMQGAFSTALNSGVNLFDTAEAYGAGLLGGWGTSERILGRCFKEADRSKAIIVTKYQPLPWRIRQPRSILAALEASCDRLNVDQVDVLLIHSPIGSINSISTLAGALAAAVDGGKAKAVGVSNYSAAEMRETHRILAERGIPLAVNQVEFSLCHALPDRNGLLETCLELEVSLLAYSPLAMGRLSGKYNKDNQPKGARRFGAHSFDVIQPILDALSTIGEAHGGKSQAQVALNWVISKGAVPIPGAKNEGQAASNAGALGWSLTPDEVDLLDGLAVEDTLKFGQHG